MRLSRAAIFARLGTLAGAVTIAVALPIIVSTSASADGGTPPAPPPPPPVTTNGNIWSG